MLPPDRNASSYGSRARRHYRRFQIKRPVTPNRSTWGISTQLAGEPHESRKADGRQPNSFLWLLIVLAITVFTFICLILMIVGIRGLLSGF